MKFNYDNVVFRTLGKLVDCLWVTILWLVCSIPIITFGAATTSLYYTVHKSIRGDRAYVTKSFFHSFKENFKQATLSWLVMLALDMVLVLDAIITRNATGAGMNVGMFYYIFLIAIVLVTGWGLVMFPYIARFSNTVKNTLKISLLLAIRHLPWTLVLLVLLAAALVACYVILPLIFLAPALLFLVYNVILERIFRRYMSPEDLAKEEENAMLDKLSL